MDTYEGMSGGGRPCPPGRPGGIGGPPGPGRPGMAGAGRPVAGGAGGARLPPIWPPIPPPMPIPAPVAGAPRRGPPGDGGDSLINRNRRLKSPKRNVLLQNFSNYFYYTR